MASVHFYDALWCCLHLKTMYLTRHSLLTVAETYKFTRRKICDEGYGSLNLERVQRLLQHAEFLNRPVWGYNLEIKDTPSRLFLAIQITLTHVALQLSPPFRALRTHYEIEKVYGTDEAAAAAPLVSEDQINLQDILHIRNFWKTHLISEEEGTFHSAFKRLENKRRPRAWSSAFGNQQGIGSAWLGYYC